MATAKWSPQAAPGLRGYLEARASSRMGVGKVQSFHDAFVSNTLLSGLSSAAASTGSAAFANTYGGSWRLQTGADPAGLAVLYLGGYQLGNTVSERFYLAGRIKLASAMGGDVRAGLWIADGTTAMYVAGFNGSSFTGGSDAALTLCGTGASGSTAARYALSTVAIDTSWHTVEFASDGSNGWLCVDSEGWVQATNVNVAANRQLEIGIAHTGTDNDDLYVDWLHVSTPEAP